MMQSAGWSLKWKVACVWRRWHAHSIADIVNCKNASECTNICHFQARQLLPPPPQLLLSSPPSLLWLLFTYLALSSFDPLQDNAQHDVVILYVLQLQLIPHSCGSSLNVDHQVFLVFLSFFWSFLLIPPPLHWSLIHDTVCWVFNPIQFNDASCKSESFFSATMPCRYFCPVLCNTFSFFNLSFRMIPKSSSTTTTSTTTVIVNTTFAVTTTTAANTTATVIAKQAK